MNLIRYRSGEGFLDSLQKELNTLFNSEPYDTSGRSSRWMPHVDIQSSDDKYTVYADIPGVDPKDINVSLEGKQLTIEGERKTEKKEESGYSRIERYVGKFYRQFTLPEDVAEDDISASCEKGVLKVIIPKSTKRAAKRIEVQGER